MPLPRPRSWDIQADPAIQKYVQPVNLSIHFWYIQSQSTIFIKYLIIHETRPRRFFSPIPLHLAGPNVEHLRHYLFGSLLPQDLRIDHAPGFAASRIALPKHKPCLLPRFLKQLSVVTYIESGCGPLRIHFPFFGVLHHIADLHPLRQGHPPRHISLHRRGLRAPAGVVQTAHSAIRRSFSRFLGSARAST